MQGHILIVEDEEAIAAFVQTALERKGFTTQWAGNGPSALSAVQFSQPDLVVLDLMLPGMDGLQVCQKLRQRESQSPPRLASPLGTLARRAVASRKPEAAPLALEGRSPQRVQANLVTGGDSGLRGVLLAAQPGSADAGLNLTWRGKEQNP